MVIDEKKDFINTDEFSKIYFQELENSPLLSKEEVTELTYEYKKGNLQARQKLIQSNLRLVVSIAKQYLAGIKSFTFFDLIQEGSIGLMRAIETYDPEKSLFSTYATPWIHSAIRRSVLEKDPTIRKPEDIEFLSRKYEKLLQEYQEKHNREPSDAYIKEQLKISDKTLHFFKEKINYDTVSLNQGIGPEEDSLELEDIIASPHNDYNNLLDNLENFNLINIIRSLLTEKEYYIIYYRIISNKQETLKTIAGQLGISAETIRVLEKKALKKIKPFIKKNSDLYQREVERQKKKQGNLDWLQ